MISVYKMLYNWSDEILKSFIVANGKRLAKSIMESFNSIVKFINKTENGYVIFTRFCNRCMYCMNKDAIFDLAASIIPIKMKGHKRGSYNKHNSLILIHVI